MMTVKEINELTSLILACESRIESLEYAIKKAKDDETINAELSITYGRVSRFSRTEHLKKEEIIPILETRLAEQKAFLADFHKRFEEMKELLTK